MPAARIGYKVVQINDQHSKQKKAIWPPNKTARSLQN